jgi:subtilase family serine protease
VVFASKLKVGENHLTVEVDPYKKTAETNENNNRFEVTIIVEP